MNYMIEADKQAQINLITNEGGPFGAVIVKNGKIVGKGKNEVLKNHDATNHAEIMAIKDASKNLNTHDLSGCILYTSCYPCPMCMSAAIWANIKEIYYGNTQLDADNLGFRDDFIYKIFDKLNNGENTDKDGLTLKQINRDICIKTFEKYKEKEDKTIY